MLIQPAEAGKRPGLFRALFDPHQQNRQQGNPNPDPGAINGPTIVSLLFFDPFVFDPLKHWRSPNL
jgi:hypothetical protein